MIPLPRCGIHRWMRPELPQAAASVAEWAEPELALAGWVVASPWAAASACWLA